QGSAVVTTGDPPPALRPAPGPAAPELVEPAAPIGPADPFIPPEALEPEQAKAEILKVWHDPPGFWGWLVTVQNGPIVERLMGTIFIFFLLGGIEALLMRTQLARPQNDFVS